MKRLLVFLLIFCTSCIKQRNGTIAIPEIIHSNPINSPAVYETKDIHFNLDNSSVFTPIINYKSTLMVDDFDEKLNAFGGKSGTFFARPSYAISEKSEAHRIRNSGKGLSIKYHKDAGWCGWYNLLEGVDVRIYNILSFWVKGQQGGESFEIGLNDRGREEAGMEAVYFGSVQAYLPPGISNVWQEVKIPLSHLEFDLDLSLISSINFLFSKNEEGTIYIDEMIFAYDPNFIHKSLPQIQKDEKHPRSIWVWKIDPILDSNARKELFQLCDQSSIEILYLYFSGFGDVNDPVYIKQIRQFLNECYKKNILVEALNGDPVWALENHHSAALAWLKSILDFNKYYGIPEAKFHGVSLDVEPYLNDEWKINRRKVEAELLQLFSQCRNLIDSYNDKTFVFGCAMPIFYEKDSNLEEKIIKYTDYTVLMDYYDNADQIIEAASYHLDLAQKAQKKMWLALETQNLIKINQGLGKNTFYEEGWDYMESELSKVNQTFTDHSGFGGFGIHYFRSYRLLQEFPTTGQRTRENKMNFISYINEEDTIIIDGRTNDWILIPPTTIA